MSSYERLKIPGGTYFFTVCLQDRSCALLTEQADLLRAAFRDTMRRHPFHIIAICILPEHLHTIWRLPEGDADFPMRWSRIKAAFSHALPLCDKNSRSRCDKNERGIWQRRYWEHWIRDEDDLLNHINYVHFNPVKHGLVSDAYAWPYSSIHRMNTTIATPSPDVNEMSNYCE